MRFHVFCPQCGAGCSTSCVDAIARAAGFEVACSFAIAAVLSLATECGLVQTLCMRLPHLLTPVLHAGIYNLTYSARDSLGLKATASTLLMVEQRHSMRLWVAAQQACPDGVAALQAQVGRERDTVTQGMQSQQAHPDGAAALQAQVGAP